MDPLDVLIVGGGLSGLSLAGQLLSQGPNIQLQLVETRSRLGGRILTHSIQGEDSAAGFDLGPAWFWPGQPRMAALVKRHELEMFDQFSDGDLLVQNATGQVQRGRGMKMPRSHRLVGGLDQLIKALAVPVQAHARLGTTVVALAHDEGLITAQLESNVARDPKTQSVRCRSVVLALPPRLAVDRIALKPLHVSKLAAMRGIPTWMAGHAKIIAAFERPFWRESGLSGDAFSHRGPLGEIHDASPASGGPFALFGFARVPPKARQPEARLVQQVRAQLVELFGPNAADPIAVVVKDWAFDGDTATQRDHQPLQHHPAYGLPASLNALWDGRLILGSTEVAEDFGGYLEGALVAAEIAAGRVRAVLRTG